MTSAISVRSRFLSRLTGLTRVSKCLPAFALLALSGLFFAVPISAQTTTADAPSYAGFWNKPSEAGWGLNLQQQGDNIFAAWYTYDADGKPTWLSMSCKLVGSQCKDNIYATTGRPLSQGLTNIGVNVSNVGIGNFTFNTTSNLTFTYTLYGKTKTISDVTKFNFAPADQVPICTQTNASRANVTNYTDTWWGGAAASGWGLSLSHQGDNIFVAMYTYSDDIKPAWATGLVTKVAGTTATYRGDFSAPRSGTPFFDINGSNATTFPLPKTGTFTLTFTSGEAATLDYDLAVAGAATSSKGRVALSRLAVATGATTSCVTGGRVTPPASDAKGSVISVSEMACGVTKDRFVLCWGDLGYNAPSAGPLISQPTLIDGTENTVSVVTEGAAACALKANGTVACWGGGTGGELGQGLYTYKSSKIALPVPNLSGVISVHGGNGGPFCAITVEKSLYCWGGNPFFVVSSTDQNSGISAPTRNNNISDVVSVAIGGGHICAIKSDSTVACWGDNDNGHLGLGTEERTILKPTTVPNLNGVVSITAGSNHTCAVKKDGGAVCWGSDSYCQLATSSACSRTSVFVPAPAPVIGITDALTIGTGFENTCALKRNGTVACWGGNLYKPNGIPGPGLIVPTPTVIPGLTDVVELTVGYVTSCALKKDGSAVCWGANSTGAVGDGTFEGEGDLKSRISPTSVLGGSIFLR